MICSPPDLLSHYSKHVSETLKDGWSAGPDLNGGFFYAFFTILQGKQFTDLDFIISKPVLQLPKNMGDLTLPNSAKYYWDCNIQKNFTQTLSQDKI